MATILSEQLFARFEQEFRPHLVAVGLDATIFTNPGLEISTEKYVALIERVAEFDDPSIGLTMGKRLEATDLGILGHAILAAADVGQMLQTLSTYIYVFSQDNSIRLDVSDQYAVVSYQCLASNVTQIQRDIEFAASGIAKMINVISGRRVVPKYVEFEYPKPDYSGKYFSAFRCESNFQRRGNRLHYDRRILDLPIPTSDPRLYEALEFYLKHQLRLRGQDDDLIRKLRHLVMATLHTGIPELPSISSQLGVSERTLQRRLRDKNIVFSDLVDNIRKSIALEYVRGTTYRLTDVAQMLGYTDPSSFTRAFKRWTDSSPMKIRNEARSSSC